MVASKAASLNISMNWVSIAMHKCTIWIQQKPDLSGIGGLCFTSATRVQSWLASSVVNYSKNPERPDQFLICGTWLELLEGQSDTQGKT